MLKEKGEIMLNDAISILKILEQHKFRAYIVGGFVRDYYQNKKNVDIDICTSAKPKELKKIFNDDITINQYGSSILKYGENKYEITSFRKESKYKDYRHPGKIKFVRSLKKDLKRRDFTMNTLCLTSDYNYIDYYSGMKDINNKIIRSIGNPDKKIKEDALRILRAIRFSTTLDFEIEDSLKKSIKNNFNLVSNLSAYYKKNELEKILLSSNRKKGIKLIKEFNLEEPLNLKNLDFIVPSSSIYGIWAQLGVVNIYPFTKSEKNTINLITKLLNSDLTDKHVLYNTSLNILKIVCEIKKIDFNIVEKLYQELPIHQVTDINITYNDIMNMYGKSELAINLLNEIEHLILVGNLENKREILIEYIKNRHI